MSPTIECARPEPLHDAADVRDASAIAIEDVGALSDLAHRGIRFDAVDTFALLPLAEVAWADGAVDAAERQVIRGVVQHCVASAEGTALIESWLTSAPDDDLHQIWCAYVAELADTVDAELWNEWRRELLFAARDVAVAAIGPLAGAMSAREAAVIRAAATALPSRPNWPFAVTRAANADELAAAKERSCN